MKTYLVTGGAGFIGSNFVHYMLKKYGDQITIVNVDALTYAGNFENLTEVENLPNYHFVKADICDQEAISKIFEEYDIDRVIHFAAESHVDRSIKDSLVFVRTNVDGTANMLNCSVSRGYECIGSDIAEKYSGVADGSAVVTAPYVQLDITNKEAVIKTITEIKPDAIIHCAAWTAVDAVEDEENLLKVDAINHLGTKYIADAAKAVNAKMLYLSTDYVFDGQGDRPWDPDDKCYAPLNVYGQSKLDGELSVANTLEKYFIVRIAWVFGLNGKNFIKTMINVGKTHDTVRVVNDQIGTPTYTADLARLLADMIETEKYGYYHATNEGGYISWYDFCVDFYKQYGLNTIIIPVSTEEYGLSKASCPFNSRLDKSKLVEVGFKPLPTWQDAVSRYLKEAQL